MLWNPRSRCQEVWFLLRPLSLACKWLPSCCVLMSFLLCAHITGVSLCVHISYFYEDTGQIRLESTLMASPLWRPCLQIELHFELLGASTYEFDGDTIQTIMVSKLKGVLEAWESVRNIEYALCSVWTCGYRRTLARSVTLTKRATKWCGRCPKVKWTGIVTNQGLSSAFRPLLSPRGFSAHMAFQDSPVAVLQVQKFALPIGCCMWKYWGTHYTNVAKLYLWFISPVSQNPEVLTSCYALVSEFPERRARSEDQLHQM